MNTAHKLVALLFTGALFGCSVKEMFIAPEQDPSITPHATSTAPNQAGMLPEPTLYARDGSVVSDSVARPQVIDPVHDVQGSSGSRMYLLELYQAAIDERDNLAREVEALNAALQKGRFDMQELQRLHAEEARKREGQATRIAELEAQNQELAARLVTAQIGRLQSDRDLLEAKIQWHQIQAMSRKPDPGIGSPSQSEGSPNLERP